MCGWAPKSIFFQVTLLAGDISFFHFGQVTLFSGDVCVFPFCQVTSEGKGSDRSEIELRRMTEQACSPPAFHPISRN